MSQLKISVPNDMLQNQKIYVQSLKQQQILCPFIFLVNLQEFLEYPSCKLTGKINGQRICCCFSL